MLENNRQFIFRNARCTTYNSQFDLHCGHVFVGFLELINNMLTSGMVPALYPDDEKEQIIGQVSEERGDDWTG